MMNDTTRRALEVVLRRATAWAVEHRPNQPEDAAIVYRSVAVLGPLTRQDDPAHHHWTNHLDDDGRWIVREPSCDYCAVMLGSPT